MISQVKEQQEEINVSISQNIYKKGYVGYKNDSKATEIDKI